MEARAEVHGPCRRRRLPELVGNDLPGDARREPIAEILRQGDSSERLGDAVAGAVARGVVDRVDRLVRESEITDPNPDPLVTASHRQPQTAPHAAPVSDVTVG